MRMVPRLLVALALTSTASAHLSAQGPPAAPATPCASVTTPPLICGQEAPEDLAAVPGGQWVVASAMAGTGGINLLRASDRTSTRLYPSPNARIQYDATAYPGCPGPPAAAPNAAFTTHGLWLEPGPGATRRLFVVGHGSRESVEVFRLDTSAAVPVLTWIGCAVAPDPVGLNEVRGLPDGGFIATNFLPRGGNPQETQKLFSGQRNGELWEWHAARGWQKVPGSEAAGANGLEMSEDGQTLYVAEWGSQSFFRLSRGRTPVERQEIRLGFRVDNLSWARDGSLLAAGQSEGATDVVRIDPKTLTVTRLLRRPDDLSFRAGTVAVEVGNGLWIGSYTGDRVGVLTP
jgi:hypothetical protein